LLSSWGVTFEGVDLEKDPDRWADLKRLNIPSYPATILGDRVVHGWNPKALAALVGVDYDPGKRFTPDELAAKLDTILAADQRALRQIPREHLGMKHPERDRTVRELGFHIFRVGLSFPEARATGYFPETWLRENPSADMPDGDAVARYGDMVRERVRTWAKQPGWCDGTVKTYYGDIPAWDFMERTTWHAAQHLRQVYWFLEQMGVTPDARLTDDDLKGLPLPREVWS
jgi:hypothetical protein